MEGGSIILAALSLNNIIKLKYMFELANNFFSRLNHQQLY